MSEINDETNTKLSGQNDYGRHWHVTATGLKLVWNKLYVNENRESHVSLPIKFWQLVITVFLKPDFSINLLGENKPSLCERAATLFFLC